MGTCRTLTAAGTVLESQLQPITAGVTITSDASRYNLNLGALGSEFFDNPADESLDGTGAKLNTLGAVLGVYLQKNYASPVGAYAAIGDFADARDRVTNASMWPAAGVGLSYTNFGLWERFVSASEGYYGGWYLPRSAADANPALPGSGTANYSGVVVGALVPVQGNLPLYGLSASLSLTANFTSSSVSGTMNNFALSNQITGLSIPNIAAVSLTGTIAPGGFTGSMGGGAASGTFEGKFFGPPTGFSGGPAEIGGRFQFVTREQDQQDARQVVGAFGGRQ